MKYTLLPSSVLILSVILLVSCSSSKQSRLLEELPGSWKRVDGNYTIEIKDVLADGQMTANYFNPNPINVGRSSWKANKNGLHIYVELSDTNYPGSNYKLTLNEKTGELKGTYFQAVTNENFSVDFKKVSED